MLSMLELQTAVEIGVIYGTLSMGLYLTFRTINFPDLTCDGSFVAGAAISSALIKCGYSPFFAAVAAIFAGGIAGLCTGVLNLMAKIEDLLSGIIVAFMLYSVNLRIMGSSPNITLVDKITMFSEGSSLSTACAITVSLVILFSYLLNTDFGLGLRAVGQNRQFAASSGVNVNSMIIVGLMGSNALVGLCGSIFSQYQGFCDISQGVGSLVIGLASVIIGEKMLSCFNIRKRAEKSFLPILLSFVSCVAGSIAYRIFIAIAVNCDALGLRTQDINLITGLLVIFVMRSTKSGRNLC
ncbi:MAG: hypothetical protein LBS14_02360 [Holosporaceae bacterium]|jgi:putative ABC transport system permease protein|nr:hypothetical protein [Holosporaceae bacterium]